MAPHMDFYRSELICSDKRTVWNMLRSGTSSVCLHGAPCLHSWTVIEVQHTFTVSESPNPETGQTSLHHPAWISSPDQSLLLLLSCVHLLCPISPHSPPPPCRTWDGVATRAWLWPPWRKRSPSATSPSPRRSVTGAVENWSWLKAEKMKKSFFHWWLSFIFYILLFVISLGSKIIFVQKMILFFS